MRVLVLNVGSSTLKHALYDGEAELSAGTQPLGDDPGAAVRGLPVPDAVAHRFVHGGTRFHAPVVVGDPERAALAEVVPLDPLHMAPALALLDAARAAWPAAPQVAGFDTAFHATIDPAAATLPLPEEWRERYGLRRFGFHGLSVQWASEQARAELGDGARRLVVAHLGAGCSVTAVRDGRSVDTTMGFTPLDGIPMATRPGALDPGVLLQLLDRGVDLERLRDGLWHESGMRGVSGSTGDMQRLLAQGEELALAVFVRGTAAGIAAMASALGGADALVFTGGIGEHATGLRERILARVAFLDARVLVVPAREELVLARAALALLGRGR